MSRAVVAAAVFFVSTALATQTRAAPHVAPVGPSPARAEAHRTRLAETSGWRRLLHAHPTAGHGIEAEPDGPSFYLSPRGVFDPEAEMLATIDALYAPASLGDKHALCMFPARARFLAELLPLDDLPTPPCTARNAFYARLRPKKVLFVFSSYHVDSPASAFGHVLLRIERDDSAYLRKDAASHALADLGIDFSADVGPENSVTYALKGLFGQFQGTFKALPYAAKVREYQDFESRDLWEYELALSDDEKRSFLEHLWELGGTSFDYFYLSENCAYHVLALLDVVRPEAHLLEALKRPVLPSDALFAVWNAPGLVARVHYRPSLRTVTHARLEALDEQARELARRLSREGFVPSLATTFTTLDPASQARVLDAALDLVDLAHPELLLDEADSPARTRKYELSMRRATIDRESPELHLTAPEGAAPHLAHGTRRVSIGSGYASGSGAFFEARARLALHDTLDPSDGMPALASLEVGEVTLRAYPGPAQAPRLEVERLTVVRVEKLAPLGTLEGGASYRFFLGGDRVRDDGCAGCFVARVEGGGGVAGALGRSIVVFARANLTLDAAQGLDGIDGRGFRVGLGPSGGVRLDLTKRLHALGEARVGLLPGARTPWTAEASFEARLGLGASSALGLFVRRSFSSADLGVSTFFYF